jgi:predicted esterase
MIGRGWAPARRMGWILFAAGGLALAARARADASPAGRWLKVGTDERPAIVYAPALDADDPTTLGRPRRGMPVITMLHGMCDTPENECNAFHPAATSEGFLLCPRANGACGNGGAIWRGSPESKRALVDDSLGALSTEFGASAVTDHDGTLIGFSQGAFLAVDMIKRSKGPWSSLILIGASIEIDARSLREAGVRRVLLAAGDYDGARPAMQRATASLVQAGFDAKFTSLGPVGHQFAFDMNAWMKEALAWVRK